MKTDAELLSLAKNALTNVMKHRELHKDLAARCASVGASTGTTVERAQVLALDECLSDFAPFLAAVREREQL